jgi:hypothetical protein
VNSVEIRDEMGEKVAAALRAKAALMPRNSTDEVAAADRVLAIADLHDPAKR